MSDRRQVARRSGQSNSGEQAIQGPNSGLSFQRSFTGKATLADGTKVLAQYDVREPTGGRAHFHFLLDTSGSMHRKTLVGGVVHEHLFNSFEELVLDGKTLRLDDTISVWCFNKDTRLLCTVKTKNFRSMVGHIRENYQKELMQRSYTRLYDAVATVTDHMRKAWEQDKAADYFLVSFTDGVDTGHGTTSVDDMVSKTHAIEGRMHTVFITANLPQDSALYQRLLVQREMKLIECESTEPGEISKAFLMLRTHIKGILVAVSQTGGVSAPLVTTRVAVYGETREALAHDVMDSLEKQMLYSSLLQAVTSMRNLQQ